MQGGQYPDKYALTDPAALKATDLANVAKALGAKPSNCNFKTAEHIVE